MLFKWKDSYSVNVKEIDIQHRKLLEIGSRVYDLASLKDDYDHYDEIMEILEELKDYTIYHFGYEEDLMKKHGYDDLDMHQMEHTFFIKKVERILRKDIDSRQDETVMEIVQFIADWVSSHILQSDMKYKVFFNENGVY